MPFTQNCDYRRTQNYGSLKEKARLIRTLSKHFLFILGETTMLAIETQVATANQTQTQYLPETLLEMSFGMYNTQAIYTVAKLGIADLFADDQDCKSVDELAQLAQADTQSLYIVLRTLVSIGIFTEGEKQQFQLTPLAKYLQSEHPSSLRNFMIFMGESWHFQVWGALFNNVKTGKSAFKHVFKIGLFPYMLLNPSKMKVLKKGMASLASACLPAVLGSYDFSSFKKIVNLNGGQDTIIAEILKNSPCLQGVLFDKSRNLKGAKEMLETYKVANRCEIVAGNSAEFVPDNCDCYVMKSTIQDWGVKRSLATLKNCHQLMKENDKILLLEKVIPPGNNPSFSKWLDLEMLVMGRGRALTEAEYREFLAQAGFQVTKVVYTKSLINVIEAVKA